MHVSGLSSVAQQRDGVEVSGDAGSPFKVQDSWPWRQQAVKRLSCRPACTSCMLSTSRDGQKRRGFALRGWSHCKRRIAWVMTEGWCAGMGGPAGAAGGKLHTVQRAADHWLQRLGRATCSG